MGEYVLVVFIGRLGFSTKDVFMLFDAFAGVIVYVGGVGTTGSEETWEQEAI